MQTTYCFTALVWLKLLIHEFALFQLESITDRMVRSCDFNINSFLSEIDQSLEASREVFRNFDAMFHRYSEEDWEKVQLKVRKKKRNRS